ncbi:hypothetical protein TUSST3_40690 [Streptomyces sp. TUS-ST3]|uniref:hypothetical protein n=1 Tax=Streptomyces sp. TUS-ST3 TaxID=3025591 RepID=UPI00235B4DAE|nr:hypothetical protein [Streptomyces sp. TUS-ST3]GLP67447.1 hypothetical protein TUSST3_40690 [Streptomyces sp. TUS-ST3]
MFRTLVGTAVHLTGAGLIDLAAGVTLRNTAGAIILANAVMTVRTSSGSLSPGSGLAVFAGYIVVLLAGATVMLRRRDA